MTSVFKTNKMKSSFLLILSLITGCESLSEVKSCKEGWVQFTCNTTKTKKLCTMAHLFRGNTFKLSIKKTNSNPSSAKQELEFEVEKNGCPKPFYQHLHKTGETIIRCDYPDKYQSHFFCKQSLSSCKDVLPGKSHQRPKFNGTKTDKGFSVSISGVSPQDAGVYWCGVNSNGIKASLKQIQLKVIANFTRSLVTGQNFSYWCKYDDSSLTKFICKGDDPSVCQLLVNTTNTGMNRKFFMNDDKIKKNISITVTKVTVKDSGVYWCGAEASDKQRFFIHKLVVTVVSPTPATPAAAATAAATAAAGTRGAVTSVIVCAAVLPSLLFLLVLIVCKRFSYSKNTGNHAEEDGIYEEIQERLQPPETATHTIYATVNPPSHAVTTHYAVVNFQTSDTVGGEALKPSSSSCQHSPVKFSKCSASSSVTQLTAEPLYSTVNKSLKK